MPSQAATESTRLMRALVLVTTMLIAPAVLGAQSRADVELTEASTIELARAHNQLLLAASARRTAIAARARQDAAPANPTFEWRSENLGSPLALDQFATVSVPLDITGRRSALDGLARSTADRATWDSVTIARRIEVDAARAYWRAVLANELLRSATEQRVAAERLAAFDEGRAQLGAIAEVAAMRTRLESNRALVAEAISSTEWRQALADLARATGLMVPEIPRFGRMPVLVADTSVIPDASTFVAAALARRSDLIALRSAVTQARQRVTVESRGVLSDIVLHGGTKQTAGYNTRVVGVSVPLPLFNRNNDARSGARAELAAAEAELRAAENTVAAEVTAAVENYRSLQTVNATAGNTIIQSGDEISRIADAAYREGGTSLIEALEAQRARNESRVAALRWMVEVRLARIELAWATSAPIVQPRETP